MVGVREWPQPKGLEDAAQSVDLFSVKDAAVNSGQITGSRVTEQRARLKFVGFSGCSELVVQVDPVTTGFALVEFAPMESLRTPSCITAATIVKGASAGASVRRNADCGNRSSLAVAADWSELVTSDHGR